MPETPKEERQPSEDIGQGAEGQEDVAEAIAQEHARAKEALDVAQRQAEELERLEAEGKLTPSALKLIGGKLGNFFNFFGEMASQAEKDRFMPPLMRGTLPGSAFLAFELFSMLVVGIKFQEGHDNEFIDSAWQFMHDTLSYGANDPQPTGLLKQVAVMLGISIGPMIVSRVLNKVLAMAYDATHKENNAV